MSNKDIADLQKQLDSTMRLYHNVKAQNAEYNQQMASRDSAITAQAAEIQSLIDQLNGKAPAKNTVANSTDQKTIDQQQRDIRDKENKIKALQKQIDQQSQQIKKLQSTSKDNGKDNSAQYKNQIAQLNKQISDQEKQIKKLRDETTRLKKSQNNSTTSNCDAVKQNYETKVKELNGQIGGYKNQIVDLNKQIKALKNDVATLQNSNSASSKDSEELKSARKELTSMTAQLNECRKQNTKYQNDVKEITANLQSARADLEKCQSDLAAQTATVKSLQSGNAAGNATEQQLRSELASLTTKEAALRAQRDELVKSHEALSQKCENDKNALQANIDALQKRVADMQQRVDNLNDENIALKSKSTNSHANAATVAQLSEQVEKQRAEIARLEKELKQRDADLAAARSEASKNQQQQQPTKGNVNQKLAELQALCDSYLAEIEHLRAENEQLKSENADLKNKVASSADLFAENERLQQKVKLASVLVTSDLKVTPGKSVKTGNVVKPTEKASQVQVVRIDCRLLDNNVIDPGSITIYARITTANNRVLCNGAAENYSFDYNGTPMQYTTKQDIEFTGYGRAISMLWRKGESVEMAPGLYWVTLYANGYEIGKTSFRLN